MYRENRKNFFWELAALFSFLSNWYNYSSGETKSFSFFHKASKKCDFKRIVSQDYTFFIRTSRFPHDLLNLLNLVGFDLTWVWVVHSFSDSIPTPEIIFKFSVSNLLYLTMSTLAQTQRFFRYWNSQDQV